jgi:tetratricopeptide (TPR) repeat protein
LLALYGDVGTARKHFQAALDKDPHNPLAYYSMALVLEREGQREASLDLFKKAILYNPTDPDILLDMGRSYFFAGNYGQAIRILKGALAFRPGDRQGYFLLGRSHLESGNYHDAIEAFHNLIALDPNFTEGYYYLGNAYDKIKNFGESHYNLGLYFEQQGDTKNAGFHFKQARKLLEEDSARRKSIQERLKSLGLD